MGQCAVVEAEIGEESRFFVGAMSFDKGALVFCFVDEAALYAVSALHSIACVCFSSSYLFILGSKRTEFPRCEDAIVASLKLGRA